MMKYECPGYNQKGKCEYKTDKEWNMKHHINKKKKCYLDDGSNVTLEDTINFIICDKCHQKISNMSNLYRHKQQFHKDDILIFNYGDIKNGDIKNGDIKNNDINIGNDNRKFYNNTVQNIYQNNIQNIQQNIFINFDKPDLSHLDINTKYKMLYNDFKNDFRFMYRNNVFKIYLLNELNEKSIEYVNKNEIIIYLNNEKIPINVDELVQLLKKDIEPMIEKTQDPIFTIYDRCNIDEIKEKYKIGDEDAPAEHMKENYEEYLEKYNEMLNSRNDGERRKDAELIISKIKNFKNELKNNEELTNSTSSNTSNISNRLRRKTAINNQ